MMVDVERAPSFKNTGDCIYGATTFNASSGRSRPTQMIIWKFSVQNFAVPETQPSPTILMAHRAEAGYNYMCWGDNRIGGGAEVGGWSLGNWRVIGGLPHFRLRGVDSPSHWLQSLGAKWQSVDHLQQYSRPGHYFVTVHFWNSDIQYTTIFSADILYFPQPGPSLVPSAKSFFVQAFFTLFLWSNTDLFYSFNWLHLHIFSCVAVKDDFSSIQRRTRKENWDVWKNRKMHLSNEQRSIATAFLPTIRYCCLNMIQRSSISWLLWRLSLTRISFKNMLGCWTFRKFCEIKNN